MRSHLQKQVKAMDFRRPYWIFLFVSLGCLIVGYLLWMLMTPDFKGEPDFRLWLFLGAEILILTGLLGLIVSLFWIAFASPGSRNRKSHPSRPNHNF